MLRTKRRGGIGRLGSTAFVAVLAIGASGAALAQSAEEFYRGKTITLISSFAPGGLSGLTGQLVGNHLGRFIPGQPNVIVQNMQGAGGLVAANFIYNSEIQDGTLIGQVDRGVSQRGIVNDENAFYDELAFNWLGSLSSYQNEAYILFINASHPVASLDEVNGSDQPVRIGVVTGGTNSVVASLAHDVLGYDFDIIRGYEGTAEILLAIERGEVDGTAMGLTNLISVAPHRWEAGEFRPLLQFGRETRLDALPDVPTAREVARNEEDRALIAFTEVIFTVAAPLLAPPNVPEDRVEALRRAFDAMVVDPQFVADATQLQLELSPVTGEEVQDLLTELSNAASEDMIARYDALIK